MFKKLHIMASNAILLAAVAMGKVQVPTLDTCIDEEHTKVIALCVRYREAIETIISDILHGRRQREVILKDYAELEHLLWMISEIEDVSNHMSLTKRHRWLGYVQTVLIFVYDYSDVETERYATRDILKGS